MAKKKDLSTGYSSFIHKGTSELDDLKPAQRGIHTAVKETHEPAQPNRERFTVNVYPDLLEWARRAVVFTPGLTLSGLMEEALKRELERREKARGEAFPSTTETPKKGRPIKLREG